MYSILRSDIKLIASSLYNDNNESLGEWWIRSYQSYKVNILLTALYVIIKITNLISLNLTKR